MLKELIKLANELDAKGLQKEADALDKIIKEAENKEYKKGPMMLRWVAKERNNPTEGSTLPIYEKGRGSTKTYHVGPPDWITPPNGDPWYTGATPKVARTDDPRNPDWLLLYHTGETEGIRFHKSMDTERGEKT